MTASLLRLALLAAAAVLGAGAADARGQSPLDPPLTCAFSGPPENTVRFDSLDEEEVRLSRVGDEIRFSSITTEFFFKKGRQRPSKAKETERPVSCPVTPTVANTDSIQIFLLEGASQDLEISMRAGLFAPGLTPEADGTSEIEIGVTESGGGDIATFSAGAEPDWFRFGSLAGTRGVNLNAQIESGSPDIDATISIAPSPGIEPPEPSEVGVGAATGGGDDLVTTDGGPEFDGSLNAVLLASGQSGDDKLVAVDPVFTYLVGGSGNDTLVGNPRVRNILFAGPGDDLLAGGAGSDDADLGTGRDRAFLKGGPDIIGSRDGKRDLVRCGGSARDFVSRDRKDRLVRCEGKTFRRIKVGSTG